MSEHLPECSLGQPCQSSEPDHVMQRTIAGIPVTVCGLCMADCICYELRSKWNEAIEAAEAMVEAVTEGPIDQPYWIDREAALTAIRALKEKT